ncbi:DUF3108 domain-containing protein [Desulfuromonas acetoxidans]|uniref:DUF3108 domain-containing protein n=1 Tax=Desulfuromonas acetoxidans TaxID=891 RepID=UPI00293165EE|nr:DUF3108 domain-containing protein [Desulfuromonas acetoxidans]
MSLLRSLLVVVWIVSCSQAFAAGDATLVERYRCQHFLLGTLGELSLETCTLDGQRMQIELAGDALGMMALLDGNRQQCYTSMIQYDSDGRVVTLSHRQSTHIDSRGRRIQYGWSTLFDEEGRVTARRHWGGEVVETRKFQIPANCYGDFLSVLYAFQHQDGPLRVAQEYRYPFFTLQGMGRIVVQVEGVESLERAASPGVLWRCRITSADGRLPGNSTSLTVWCDDQRRVVKAEAPFLWGLGKVVIQRISESS